MDRKILEAEAARLLDEGKHACRVYGEDGDRYLLCSTPLAFTDLIDGELYDLVCRVAISAAGGFGKEPDADLCSGAVSEIEGIVLDMLGCRAVVYGSLEF